MTETQTKQRSYRDPLTFDSLVSMLSGLNPEAILYGDANYGTEKGASYYPSVEIMGFGRHEISTRLRLMREPVTVGEFLDALRTAPAQLAEKDHVVRNDCHILLMADRQFHVGAVSGIIMNGDGSFTLNRTTEKFWE